MHEDYITWGKLSMELAMKSHIVFNGLDRAGRIIGTGCIGPGIGMGRKP